MEYGACSPWELHLVAIASMSRSDLSWAVKNIAVLHCTYIHSVACAHCLQMVSLYRDPTGKKVFLKTSPTDDHYSDHGSRQNHAENQMFEVGYTV